MKTKLLFTALIVGYLHFNSVELRAQKAFDNNPFSVVQVINSEKDNLITIIWNDNRFEEIEIHNQEGIFMPSIPLMGQKQLQLNDLHEGDYLILFKKQNEILATKGFKINEKDDLAKN